MRRVPVPAALILLVLSLAAPLHGQTVDEIVAKNLASKGGAEKWKSVTTFTMTGTVSMQGMEFQHTVTAKRPNLTRQEMVIKDARLVQAFDGTTAWAINPMTGSDTPQELPAPVTQLMKETADFDGPLVDYKAKGNTVELVGKEKLASAEVYHLKITGKTGQVQHYYLDAATGVEVKKSMDVETPMGKQTLDTEMSDYRSVNGVMIAHSIRQMVAGKPVAEMKIDKVELNAPADDSLFRMPKK
jgi:outer membrane lipoprotein-sorting protein